ncbi:MAG: deoxyribonuclease IV [candidate division Zixibacteria bacterium]|nr:deoxyribonuclease IV [candidate division Zixibacteria bacterium]
MLFGAHESIAGGVFNAVERGHKATCDTIQMFNKSNNQWRAKKLDPKEIDKFFEAIETTGVTVALSHTSYLINIASPDDSLGEKSRRSLRKEMQRCNLLKIPNLVMHPGSHVGSGEETGMARIVENINRMFDDLSGNDVTLLLESTAGQGSNLGYRFEQLAQMIDGVENKDHMGVCLDTCHIFAAGYPLTDPTEYKGTIKQFDDVVGLDLLKVIHMNDSKKEFGSRKDRHEHIGKGYIGLEGFRNIVNDRRLKNVPMILETPKGDDLAEDIENLAVLRGLVK